MNADEHRSMFELQLELHARAENQPSLITADDLIEVHGLLAIHRGDLRSLVASTYR